MSGASTTADAPLAHEEAIGMLDDLAEGELDEAEASAVRAHLATCDRCQAVQAALGGGLKSAVRAESAAPDLLPGVQRRLRLRSRGRFYGETDGKARAPSPWPLLVASFTVLVGLVVAYVLLGHMGAGGAP
jgi:anti-sigma factor RsiW